MASDCQINPSGLQHMVGLLVLSYELGVTLSVKHFKSMLKRCGNSTAIQLKSQQNMAIITEFYSNHHSWKDYFFFIRVDEASVEASGNY